MKKIYLGLIAFTIIIFASCSNDEIKIEKQTAVVTDALTLSINLTNFYSSYNYDDTQHNIEQIAEAFRTFNSENKKYIQVRSLIYNKNSYELVDSIVEYVTTINAVSKTIDLVPGNYTAITTLSFADAANTNSTWWYITDRENLSTAKLCPRNSYSKWSILSQSVENFQVTRDQNVRLNTTPSPLGALVYTYLQNFQFIDEASYGNVADNKVREIAIYTQRKAESYNLDPEAESKFNYRKETATGNWYYNDFHRPTHFDESWEFFKSNLYAFYYVLEPEQRIVFGLKREGDTEFDPYGEQNISYKPGTTYLAYWDYFKIGNPYMGIADNNHWNTYHQSYLFEIPYTSWGASLSTVKSIMSSRNYTLLSEDANYLLYGGKNSENAVEYDFENSSLSSAWLYFDTSISLTTLSNYVAKNSNASYYGNLEDGTIVYTTNDGKSLIFIYEYTFTDGTKLNIVMYGDRSVSSQVPSKNATPKHRIIPTNKFEMTPFKKMHK